MEDRRFSNNASVDAAIRYCIGLLSETDAEAFRKKFAEQPHDRDQVKHTFAELVVGAYLASQGMTVQAERRINGKTPDWSVLENGALQCILEVANFHTSQSTRDDINDQMAETGLALAYHPDHAVRLYPLLQGKCTAYTALIDKHCLPYVIGLFLHFDAAVNREQVLICLNDAETGLFKQYPHVSGVLEYQENRGVYRFDYIANPHASRPLTLPTVEMDLSLPRHNPPSM